MFRCLYIFTLELISMCMFAFIFVSVFVWFVFVSVFFVFFCGVDIPGPRQGASVAVPGVQRGLRADRGHAVASAAGSRPWPPRAMMVASSPHMHRTP